MKKSNLMYFVVGAAIFISSIFYYLYTSFAGDNFLVRDGDWPAYVFVSDTTDFHDFTNDLYDRKILQHPESFAFAAKVLGYQESMRPGLYRIEPGLSNVEAIKVLTGNNREDVFVTFDPTQSSEELSKQLCAELDLADTTFLRAITDVEKLKKWRWTPHTLWATFIPGTYRVFKDATAQELLENMVYEGNQFYTVKKQQKAQDMELKRMQVMILASMVYQEVRNPEDYKKVAGVYLNRLRDSIPLESMAAAEFGCSIQDDRLDNYEDLFAYSGEYNTRDNIGLPPSPICIPTKEAVDAVVYAEEHEFLYMSIDSTGKHFFAETLEEHQLNLNLSSTLKVQSEE